MGFGRWNLRGRRGRHRRSVLGGSDEASVECPGDVCSGFGTDASGNTAWVEFVATAGGVSSYYNPEDLTNGIYEYGGQLYDATNYQALLEQQYAARISSQCSAMSANLAAASSGAATVDCNNVQYIQGGHANFSVECGDWMNGNCSGRWVDGLHIEGDPTTGFWGHNDTASYYIGSGFNWATFSPWDLAAHGFVDVIGGNTAVYVFPQ